MTRKADIMAAAATERLNRSIGQRARRAREAIGRQAAADRAAVDRLWPAPRLVNDIADSLYMTADDRRFVRLGESLAAVDRVRGRVRP